MSKILLTYLLFLAFNACSHDCTANYCQTEGIVHIEEQHNDDHSDVCSPMCNCVCCNTIVSVSNNYSLQTSFNIAGFQASFSDNLIPFVQNPASPPPKT